MALEHSITLDYYESKTSPNTDIFKDTISLVIRFRGIKRTFTRGAHSCLETLIQQTTIGTKRVLQLMTKIPRDIVDENFCGSWLARRHKASGIPGFIVDRIVPEITKEVTMLNREKKGEIGFKILSQVGFTEETWFTDVTDDDDSQDHPRLQTEQDSCCTICLEPLGESSTTTTKLLCSHRFDRDCILRWLQGDNNLSCPVCRYNVT